MAETKETKRYEGIVFDVDGTLINNEMAVLQSLSDTLGCCLGRSMAPEELTFCLGSSICATAAVNSLMLTMRYVPTSVLYTISNGGVLVMSTLLSRAVFREKLNSWMIAGILGAIGALVLLSL